MTCRNISLVKLLLCLLPHLVAAPCFSQLNTYPQAQKEAPLLQPVVPANGLPEQLVTGVVQDNTGFIWIATQGNGLVRYDGENTKRFTFREGDKNSLASNAISYMHRDGLNRLWLIYNSGEFDLFDPVTEKVWHLSAGLNFFEKADPFIMNRQEKRIQFLCLGLSEDSRRRVWLFFEGLAARIDAGDGSVLFYPRFSRLQDRPTTVTETEPGRLAFVTNTYVLETDDALRPVQRTPLPAKSYAANNDDFWPYTLRKKDTLYIGAEKGVNVYDLRTRDISFRQLNTSATLASLTQSPKNDRFLFYDTVSAHLFQYTAGEAGFADLGKYEYNTEADRWRVLNYKLTYLFDKAGGLWHANQSFFYSAGKRKHYTIVKGALNPLKQVSQYVYHYSDAIASKLTNTLYEGYPWLRSPSGAFYVVDSTRTLRLAIPVSHITALTPDDHKWTVIHNGQNSPMLSAGNFDAAGKLWVLDRAKYELFTIDTAGLVQVCPKKIAPGFGISALLAAKKGGCWVNQYIVGLGLYSIEKGLVKRIDGKTAKSRMPETSFFSMVRDSADKNIIWISTIGSGVVRFKEKEETWRIYTEQDGWPSNSISSPIMDERGFLWYQAPKGVYRYDTRQNRHQLVMSDPMYRAPDWTSAYSLVVNSHQLWFGSGSEVAIVNTDEVPVTKNVVTVFTGLRINNKPVTVSDTSVITAPVNTLAELLLSYNQNFISFQFAALNYNFSGQIRYRYRLEGIDEDWVNNGTSNEAQYTSLPPGHYIFKVNATNEDGTWSSEVKSIRVVISPPWWRTWWMYAIYGVLVIAAAWLFLKTRLRRLQLNQQVLLKQKEAEQAQALEETKSRFFANITHELRTPLTLILSPVQRQLRDGAATYSPQLLNGVYQNSKILLRLINQLLDMSKLESGKMPVTLSCGNLAAFVERMLDTFREAAAAKNIRLNFEQDDFATEHLFDSDKLEKILHNLFGNAFKFTPNGGSITVSVGKMPLADGRDTVAIRVADSGIGIAAAQLPHVFNRFYQANNSTTRKYEGSGIGLSLVKEFAELMGGGITAESTEGQGSVFTLSLPLAVATGQADAPPVDYPATEADALTAANVVPLSSGITPEDKRPVVLVTDDNGQLRQFIADSLAPQYKVITAANGEEGLQLATTELPELIVSDVMMPVMDGYEFCEQLKATPLTSHIGFVMLTAKTADASRLSGLRLGADHYLNKPFNVEELLLVVANLLHRQQKLREFYSRQLQPASTLPPVKEVEDAFLKSVYAIIEENLDSDKLDVDFLASEMAVSRRTLNRKLSAIADTSANEVIRNYRLKKAAALLLKGEPVSGAAYATGFSTPSWFSQCFKELYGISPVQYTETGGLLSQN